MKKVRKVDGIEMTSMLQVQARLGQALKMFDTEMTEEQRKIVLEQSRVIERVGCQMINNARFMLDTEKHQAQLGVLEESIVSAVVGEFDAE